MFIIDSARFQLWPIFLEKDQYLELLVRFLARFWSVIVILYPLRTEWKLKLITLMVNFVKRNKNFVLQDKVFRMQLRLAMEYKLPICLHIRNADEDGLKIMSEEKVPSDHPIHLHCFTGCWADCQSWMKKFSRLKVGFTITRG